MDVRGRASDRLLNASHQPAEAGYGGFHLICAWDGDQMFRGGIGYDLSPVRHVWVLRKVGDRLLLASARVIVVVL